MPQPVDYPYLLA